jgi:hypothetical protein
MRRRRSLAGATALAVAAGAAYGIYERPRMARWGATQEEAAGPLPGDEIVLFPRYQTTHAVTVSAPVDQVWPWLAQMGQGRGGLYSYDRIENLAGLRFRSADHIIPDLQDLGVGDVVRLTPEDVTQPFSFVVAMVERPHLLVLGPKDSREDTFAAGMPYPTWTFRLTEVDPGSTRLLVRFRSDFRPNASGWVVNKYALEPVHFLMERKMMLGIKERAEHAPGQIGW